MNKLFLIIICLFLISKASNAQQSLPVLYGDRMQELMDKIRPKEEAPKTKAKPESLSTSLLKYAKTLVGVPYKYASNNPKIGFDCSGFVNYVFKKIGVKVPRSSAAFKYAGTPTKLSKVKAGDLLLFTGSNANNRQIGHVGIVYKVTNKGIKFIHASSTRSKGVVISDLDAHYKKRFMQGVSILE